MNHYPVLRFVFDRRKQATKKVEAPVLIEVYFRRERKYIPTGVKVCVHQWSDKNKVKTRKDSDLLNEQLDNLMRPLQNWVKSLKLKDEEFTFKKLDKFLTQQKETDNFLEFMAERIEKRDVSKGTKRNHLTCLSALKKFEKIETFDDLTLRNVKLFDDFLHEQGYLQTTVHKYHKSLRTYIHEAIALEKLTLNPYITFRVKKGAYRKRKYLTQEELEKLIIADMENSSLEKVRDCFLFSCYTGLSHVDLKNFDVKKIIETDGKFFYEDERIKSGINYKIVLLTPAMDILRRYNFKLPVITNQQYNLRLKIVALRAGLNKELTSHMARHTFATWALSSKIRLETVSKMLGHTKVKTTEIYAHILQEEVTESFDLLERRLSR